MKTHNLLLTNMHGSLMMAVIERAGVPALRTAFTLAVIVFFFAGLFIWRKRHQFFDRDLEVENDIPVVRHNREEVILTVWTGLAIVLIAIMCAAWRA